MTQVDGDRGEDLLHLDAHLVHGQIDEFLGAVLEQTESIAERAQLLQFDDQKKEEEEDTHSNAAEVNLEALEREGHARIDLLEGLHSLSPRVQARRPSVLLLAQPADLLGHEVHVRIELPEVWVGRESANKHVDKDRVAEKTHAPTFAKQLSLQTRVA